MPEKVALKDPSDFRIVGKRTKRLDTPAKVNGTAEFGIDVKLPGMVYASLEQCPVIGGTVKSFDASKAKAMPGVVDVVQIPDGVAVVADTYWHAKKARAGAGRRVGRRRRRRRSTDDGDARRHPRRRAGSDKVDPDQDGRRRRMP